MPEILNGEYCTEVMLGGLAAAPAIEEKGNMPLGLIRSDLTVFLPSAIALIAVLIACWALEQEHNARLAARIAADNVFAYEDARKRFLSAARHDMRQPLHALSLYITALERRVESAEARDILTKMERAADSLARMFAALLDLDRLRTNETRISDFPVLDMLRRLGAEYKGVELSGHDGAGDLRVCTDADLLEALLRQLIANAVTHGGDSVRIETATYAAQFLISIIDCGPGIASEDHARIFEEFVRLEGSHRSEGLGLGLAIARRIADLLQISLTVDSNVGEGATFTVSVPLARPS